MPVVSAPAVTLQRATSSGYYPSSGAGFAEVNIASGDDIQLTINPYSGVNANQNIRIHGSAGLSFTDTFSTNTNMPAGGGPLVKTIENVSGTGLISIFAKPAYGSIPFGYRARISVGPAYGLEVFDTNGTSRVLSPSQRFGVVLKDQTLVFTSNTRTINMSIPDGTGITSNLSVVLIGFPASQAQKITVTIGTNTVSINLSGITNPTCRALLVRI